MYYLLALEAAQAIAGAVAIAVAATVGAICMMFSIRKALDSIVKQPEMEGKIRSTLILGLVFIETAIIYALIIALLVMIL